VILKRLIGAVLLVEDLKTFANSKGMDGKKKQQFPVSGEVLLRPQTEDRHLWLITARLMIAEGEYRACW